MSETLRNVQGPLGVRLLIKAGTLLLLLLFIWAIGFVLDDVARYGYVDWKEVRQKHVPKALDDEIVSVRNELTDRRREVEHLQERIRLVGEELSGTRDATGQIQSSEVVAILQSRDTSGQFLDLIAESQRHFQDATRRRHELVMETQEAQEKVHVLENRLAGLEREVEEKEKAARDEQETLARKRDLIAGVFKLLVLLPFVAVAAWLFVKKRSSRFAPIIYAFGLAVLIHLVTTIHGHFPKAIYKYILVIAAIICVVIILVKLIQSVWKPARETVLKRCRQAYRKGECGVCGYPIRWKQTETSLSNLLLPRRLSLTMPAEAFLPDDEGYTCPSCGTTLYEECSSCGKVRHSLLPSCRHCGAEKELPDAEG